MLDRLLGQEPRQRIRLLRTSIAMLLMGASAAGVLYLAWAGVTPRAQALWWTLLTLGSFIGFFALIRSGLNRRFADPSLTVAQMVVALLSSVWAYAIVGPGRGAVFPTPIVVLMFGMYSLRPRTVQRLAWLAIALFGATMTTMALRDPAVYAPRIEVVHFFVLSVMLLAVGTLAGQLSRLRQRLRSQKAELVKALERIQDLATRDELTGLINRRSMQEVLQLEHQRCVRSGHPFCVVMVDLDHFKHINDTLGHAAGDAVLRAFAAEARAVIRVSDVLGRWGGEEFLLLMTDTRGWLARQGVERLRERVAALHPAVGASSLQLTLSAGLAEHRAGEPLADTIARADQAVYAAKAQGRNRVVLM
ncbi:diguanylate cyclase [Piscinibacter sp. XHJ-5]|uniref:diguanylate cyclase n=1 Tax=Piscinibacter sp. XHJ-5 TaxID=3037797 RepID=UPI00245311BE|nr:diguanylate cyclase [Piscinibacter sp. XHJ-5]